MSEAPPPHVAPCRDVRPFFHEQVNQAADALGIDIASVAGHYLTALLSDLAVTRDGPRVTTPLADLMTWAMESGDAERPQRLRHLGDVSLMICGFFPDSFERRGISYRYVESMGRGAYVAVDAALEARCGPGDGSVFGLLAGAFDVHVRVLDEVRERTTLRTRGDVAALYERWLRSRSPSIGGRLAELGLQPSLPEPGGQLH